MSVYRCRRFSGEKSLFLLGAKKWSKMIQKSCLLFKTRCVQLSENLNLNLIRFEIMKKSKQIEKSISFLNFE